MQSIITKYYGATNTKPSCIRAWTSGNPKVRHRFSYDHGLNADANHREAAAWVASQLKWNGQWVQGTLDANGYIFVGVKGADGFTVAT